MQHQQNRYIHPSSRAFVCEYCVSRSFINRLHFMSFQHMNDGWLWYFIFGKILLQTVTILLQMVYECVSSFSSVFSFSFVFGMHQCLFSFSFSFIFGSILLQHMRECIFSFSFSFIFGSILLQTMDECVFSFSFSFIF